MLSTNGHKLLRSEGLLLCVQGSRNRPHTGISTVLFPRARFLWPALAPAAACRQNCSMRPLIGILVAAGLLLGVYYFYLKKMPTTDEGTAPTQAISLTGVRSDLLHIAQAERTFTATNDHCASLDELISTNSVSMSRPERDGYVYTLDCSREAFTVTARHAPAPSGSPIRYPNFAIDQSMEVHEVD